MDEIAAGNVEWLQVRRCNIRKGDADSRLRKSRRRDGRKSESPPKFVEPQLATLVDAPPEGDDWVHEIKYDGYRVLAAIGGGEVRIYTRTGLDWTDKFRPLAPPARRPALPRRR